MVGEDRVQDPPKGIGELEAKQIKIIYIYSEWITGKSCSKFDVLKACVKRIGRPQFLTNFDET